MIEETRAYMASFPRKAKPFYYLEDRRQDDFDIGKYRVGNVGYLLYGVSRQRMHYDKDYCRILLSKIEYLFAGALS